LSGLPSQLPHPLEQVRTQAPEAQFPEATFGAPGGGQLAPQARQFELVLSGSQPLVISPSQSPVEGAHAQPHTPLVHAGVVLAKWGQLLLQAPQWSTPPAPSEVPTDS
jgi:hypothetical protein